MRQIKIKRKATNHHRFSVNDEKKLLSSREAGMSFREIRKDSFPERTEKSLSEKCRREGWIFRKYSTWTEKQVSLLSESGKKLMQMPEMAGKSLQAIKNKKNRMKK